MKFNLLQVSGFHQAIKGMRNPLKSYNKADSEITYPNRDLDPCFELGENDYSLASRLFKAGPEHRKWMRMVYVWVDIWAPRYWWSEFDTYKVGTAANSESTMHKLKDESFDKKDFEFDWGVSESADKHMEDTLKTLKDIQSEYQKADSSEKEKYHRLMKQILPESFIQKRTVCLNYEVLANMYKQRKNHRLPQWSVDFVNFVKALPYSEFVTGEFKK